MDEIILNGIIASGHYGCCENEKENAQDFNVSLRLLVDFTPCVKTDDLSLALDYPQAIDLVKEVVAKNSFNLIEPLAELIAKELFIKFAILKEVYIDIRKLECEKNFKLEKIAFKIHRKR
ncbi:MAG: dihydroneopterin aldolase [Opitutales bacterium]